MNKTFRDILTETADSIELKALDVSNHIKNIREKMERVPSNRTFTVSLIEPTSNTPVAIGNSGDCCYTIFIPKFVTPDIYLKKFTDAFKELGFTDSNNSLTKGVSTYKSFNSYDITLRW